MNDFDRELARFDSLVAEAESLLAEPPTVSIGILPRRKPANYPLGLVLLVASLWTVFAHARIDFGTEPKAVDRVAYSQGPEAAAATPDFNDIAIETRQEPAIAAIVGLDPLNVFGDFRD
jgi:hypothetical protein